VMELAVRHESWPLARAFAIARGSRTTAEILVVELVSDGARGRGECVPYSRYGETIGGVRQTLERLAPRLQEGLTHAEVQRLLPPGAARNGLDCALWDWRAKRAGVRVHELLGLPPPLPLTTAYTLSLDTPERMAAAARENASRPLLKSKLAGDGDLERMAAVRENAPDSALIVDANEGWRPELVEPYCAALAGLGVTLVEQPLSAAEDAVLAQVEHAVPLCADESCHTREDLERMCGRYDVINIKLEKTGGLTEALALRGAARECGLRIMVGCMLGTSLAMAPAALVAQQADWVDLDGPLLIGRDRQPGLVYQGSRLYPCQPALWG
jgi:L-Ala-D/L-Glu epimerase